MRIGYDATNDLYYVVGNSGQRVWCKCPDTLYDFVEAADVRTGKRKETLATCLLVALGAALAGLIALIANY